MNCFKVTAYLCSCVGPEVISCYVIMNRVSAEVLCGFLLDRSRDRETAGAAEKIASQIVAAEKASAAEIRLCLSFLPFKLHDVTLMSDLVNNLHKVHFLP